MKAKKRIVSLFLCLVMLLGFVFAFPMGASAANSYTINGKTFTYQTFSSYGDNCWNYANALYQYIWGSSFNSYRTQDTNYLRNLSASELTITLAHMKEYISKAPLGSVIRFSTASTFDGADGDPNGHSAILVAKSSTGFTVCQGGFNGVAAETTWTYEFWTQELVSEGKQYIKYIKWPGGTAAYNGNGGNNGGQNNGSTLSGSTNAEKAWNYLKSLGYSDCGCAGILGNLYCESGITPNNLQNSYESSLGYSDASYTAAVDNGSYSAYSFAHDSAGYGIAQWTYWSRKEKLYNLAKSRGTSIADLETQLVMLTQELESYGLAYYLKNSASVYEASNIMLLQYEKPANQSVDNQNRRASVCQSYYDSYASGPVTYQVRYDAAGGTGAPATQTKIHGQDLTMSTQTPKKDGYIFRYWYASFTANGYSYTLFKPANQTNIYNVDANVTFTAMYEQLSGNGKLEFTYDLKGGEGYFPNQYKTIGEPITIYTQTPVREGYTFSNWHYTYSTGNGGAMGNVNPGTEWTMDVALDLEANWKENHVLSIYSYATDGSDNVVTFDVDDYWGNLATNVSYYYDGAAHGRVGYLEEFAQYTIKNIKLNGACSYRLVQGALKGDVDHDTYVKIESVPHSYSMQEVKKATATAAGLRRYTCTVCGKSYDEEIPMLGNPFTDVKTSDYYYSPVLWAVDKGVTTGTSATSFAPKKECSRAEIVTFLWRAAGCPKPSTQFNPFTDVKEGAWYYQAVLWAVEKGITTGTGGYSFSPQKTCTRAEAVTFLWRANGKPSGTFNNKFTDISYSAYYSNAIMWAVEQGITSGMTSTTFEPNTKCIRGQIVTFLSRTYNK